MALSRCNDSRTGRSLRFGVSLPVLEPLDVQNSNLRASATHWVVAALRKDDARILQSLLCYHNLQTADEVDDGQESKARSRLRNKFGFVPSAHREHTDGDYVDKLIALKRQR